MSVAILDDDASVRTALSRLLEASSYQVLKYGSAQEFIDTLHLQAPACLIVDQQMEDMTGEELLHHLAAAGIAIPTIILTAHDDPGIQERCEKAGALAFLLKPVAADELLNAVAAAGSRTG